MGYGSRGHAHALNLQSGVDVRVGLPEGSSSVAKAEQAGLPVLTVADASAEADLIMFLGPDTEHKAIFNGHIAPNLKAGDALFVGHGFSVRFQQVVPPADVDVALVAPKGPGHLVRRTYTEGGGVPCLIAVSQDASGRRATSRCRTPRPSAVPVPACSRPPSRRRPRPTSSASRWCSAVASPPWCRRGSRRSSRRATSPSRRTSSASTS